MVFVKQHLYQDTQITKNRSITETASQILSYLIINNKRSANITWQILGTHQAYSTSSKRCALRLNQKLKIAFHRNSNMLNRRIETLNKCRHKNKYALIPQNRVKFSFKVSTKRFTQNYYFQESGCPLFPGSSPDY